MDKWKDLWIDAWIDLWMAGSGWIDGRTEGMMNRWSDRFTLLNLGCGRMERQIQVDRDGWLDGGIHG